MMNLKEMKLEPFEDTWRDWFIIDKPKEKINVTIILDHTRHFSVDSRFQRFKLTGITDGNHLPHFKVYYLFREGDPMMLQYANGYTMVIDDHNQIIECIISREE